MTTKAKLITAGAALLVLLAGVYGARAMVDRYLAARLAAREAALSKDVEKYQGEVAEQAKLVERARADAQRARDEAARYKQQAAKLLRERQDLQAEVDRLAAARQTAREEVARVPQGEIRGRIRAGLVDLRGPARPGG